jgi:single-stranded DNA-binding protein
MGVITIFGNITRDAENRTTQGEKPTNVTSFSVAENDRRTKETIFYDCSYWGQGGKNVS